jgi:hypothetical protein
MQPEITVMSYSKSVYSPRCKTCVHQLTYVIFVSQAMNMKMRYTVVKGLYINCTIRCKMLSFDEMFLCLVPKDGNADGRILSVHSKHFRHYSIRSLCLGCWRSWLATSFLHCADVLHLREYEHHVSQSRYRCDAAVNIWSSVLSVCNL